MWQLYVLGSLFASAGEDVVDKVAIVSDKQIDSMVATFWRIMLFFVSALVIGAIGILGGIQFIFAPVVFIVALLGIGNSLIYTSLLRRVEITGIGAISYLAPFLYLTIDMSLLHTQLSPGELVGVFLMVFGGFAFAVDGKTHRLKKEMSLTVWLMFVYMALYTGAEGYAFQYLHGLYATSAVAYTLSYGLLMCVCLFFLILIQGKANLLWKSRAKQYIPYIAVSKAFDATGAILWTQALTLAALSQVSAMGALEPLVIFVVTITVQEFMQFRAEENLGYSHLKWKVMAVSMLVIGGLLLT